MRELGFEVFDPWDTGFEISAPEAEKEVWEQLNVLGGEKNAKAIESSDGMLAVLDGTDVDSGRASNTGYAFAFGEKILDYRGDFRLTGDNPESMINFQAEYFNTKNRRRNGAFR